MSSSFNQRRTITRLLSQAADGSDEAKEELYRIIYDDLRDAARRVIRNKHRGDFQTTALVHESLLRFENEAVMKRFSENRRVFFSVAVRAMQQILVDHYRRRRREAGGNMRDANPFEIAIDNLQRDTGFDFEALSLAIDELKQSSPRQHAVVVHRFFGGLRVEDTAELLNVSVGTVERDWRLARAKLMRRLRD